MKCYQCGQEIENGQSVCPQCGTDMGDGATTLLDQSNNPYIQQPNCEQAATTPLYEQAATTPLYQQPAAPAYKQPAAPDYQQPAAPVFAQQMPAQPYAQPAAARPLVQHPTGRGLLKMIFLGLITGGIYNIVIFCRIVTELNVLATRYDGRRTMPFFAMVMLAPYTLFIVPIVWYHNICDRIGNELNRRGCNYKFSAATFWLWNVLGGLILIGPLVFMHKFMKAMNLLNKDFNARG